MKNLHVGVCWVKKRNEENKSTDFTQSNYTTNNLKENLEFKGLKSYSNVFIRMGFN